MKRIVLMMIVAFLRVCSSVYSQGLTKNQEEIIASKIVANFEMNLKTIEEGVNPPVDIGSVEPYTVGSNQEWALWALTQLDNSEEKIRLYNCFLKALTYLQIHDKHDYIDEYNAGKADFELRLQNTADEATRKIMQAMLDDEGWYIDVKYPLPEKLETNYEQNWQVFQYLRDANCQLFLIRSQPLHADLIAGRSIGFAIPAYYAFADRRQQTHQKILDGFDAFKSNLEKAKIDTSKRYDVAKYVYDDVIKTLTHSHRNPFPNGYSPRKASEEEMTILGYFSDLKITVCDGYSRITAYLNNRLGIPTIYQFGSSVDRDASGNITGSVSHAWNITQMENEQWYFTDAMVLNYLCFLRGQGTGGTKPEEVLWGRVIADNMLYPEVAIKDYDYQSVTNEVISSILSVVYPNPAADVLNVRIESAGEALITLVNLLGSTVFQQTTSQAVTAISVQSFTKGLYILTIQIGGQTKAHKVIIR